MSGSSGPQSTNADIFAWIGLTNGRWTTPANWRDSSNPQYSGTTIPGSLTPVIIANRPGAGYQAITVGGTAASLGITGNLDLLGTYAVGAVTTVGSLATTTLVPTPASVVLSAATTLTTNGLNVLDGNLALASGAAALSNGAITIGAAGGFQIPVNGAFAYAPGSAGNLLLSPHATVTAAADLTVTSGSITDVGGTITVGDELSVGTTGTVVSQSPLQTISTATGRVVVSQGGTVAVAGDIMAPQGVLVVTGAGSALHSPGTLTAGTGGDYSYTVNGIVDTFSGALLALNGGSVQLGGLILDAATSAPFADTVVYVDATSSIEIGSTGHAQAGTITIDPNQTVTARASGGLYGFLADNGTLIVSAGTLVQSGDVSGNGTIGIARDATWQLSGTITNTNTISFLDTGAQLTIGGAFSVIDTAFGSATNTMGAVVKGFQPGDAIVVSDPVTSATFAAGVSGNPGTLTLKNNGTTVEDIHLIGTYTASNFAISPVVGGGAVVSLLSSQAAPAPGAANNHRFAWTGSFGGTWGSASNWRDLTTATAATVVPGTLTPVTIAAPTGSGAVVISGGGTAAALSLTGSLDLVDRYAFGASLTVGSLTLEPGPVVTTSALSPGSLHLLSGGSIGVGTVNIIDGDITLQPGARLATSGTISIGTAPGRNVLNSGTYVPTAGASGQLNMGVGATLTAAGGMLVSQGSVTNDDGLMSISSSLVLGTAVSNATDGSFNTAAAAGTVAVMNGGSLSVAGAVSDINGIIVADGIGTAFTSNGTLTVHGNGSYTDVSTFDTTIINASVAALNDGFVQVAGADFGGPTATGLFVDSDSTIEIGNAGGATVGAITIDASNRISTSASLSITGNLINNGTLAVNSGICLESGTISGAGVIQLGSNATLHLNGSISNGQTIALLGNNDTLAIGKISGANGTSTIPLLVDANLIGFGAGDTLSISQPITTATFTAGVSGAPGKLALTNRGTTVATLTLTGNYLGRTFTVTPTTAGTNITLANNLAIVGMQSLGLGTLTQTASGWSIDLGTAVQGASSLGDIVGFANVANGPVGVLSGTFSAANVNGFTNNGFTAGLSGLASGQEEHQQTISLSTATAGVFSESISLAPTSTNDFGSTPLAPVVITVVGTILPAGASYMLTGAPTVIGAGVGNDVFNATSTGLNSRTSINGGGGSNVLNLNGGGSFDLGAPRLLANIPTINVAKTSTLTTVFLRDANSETLNVGAASDGAGTSIIYGGTGSDTINLTAGTDTVILGSAAETVHAGAGNTLVETSMAFAAASVVGSTVGTTALEITSGGAGGLSPLDTNIVVTLDLAAQLSLGAARFVTAIGSGGSDTIIADGASQTLSGGGSSDLLIGSSLFGDTFTDTSNGLNTDAIGNFGGNDLIDITDLAFNTLFTPSVTAGHANSGATSTLSLTDGVHSAVITFLGSFASANFQLAADGHSGTQVTFLASP